MSSDASNVDPRTPRRFRTTRWSIVQQANGAGDEQSRLALDELCHAYWYPLYAFARRQGNDSQHAADLTQGFFLDLLANDRLDAADPERGRFRTFLLTAFRNYCRNEHRNATTLKRGGAAPRISIDAFEGESRYAHEPADPITPEHCYERQWAVTLLERTQGRLRDEFHEASREPLFNAIQGRLAGGNDDQDTYAEIAERLGLTETAVKVAVHRMRARFRELLRQEVQQTLAQQDDVDDELRRLFQTFET